MKRRYKKKKMRMDILGSILCKRIEEGRMNEENKGKTKKEKKNDIKI